MAAKIPKVVRIREYPHGYVYKGQKTYEVGITIHQFKKLPLWVRDAVTWCYDLENDRHAYLEIRAVDEMQAFARFQQLWLALPKE